MAAIWSHQCIPLDGNIIQYRLFRNAEELSFADVIGLWQTSPSFRSNFTNILRDVSFSAYRWETPPITVDKISRIFEFVLVNSPELIAKADPVPFARYFTEINKEQDIVVFDNLGKDATLVVPCPVIHHDSYSHLAEFVRRGPESQVHAMWQTVGRAVQIKLESRPLWLSTAGAGVAWLHVRLDTKPKYYSYKPYVKFE